MSNLQTPAKTLSNEGHQKIKAFGGSGFLSLQSFWKSRFVGSCLSWGWADTRRWLQTYLQNMLPEMVENLWLSYDQGLGCHTILKRRVNLSLDWLSSPQHRGYWRSFGQYWWDFRRIPTDCRRYDKHQGFWFPIQAWAAWDWDWSLERDCKLCASARSWPSYSLCPRIRDTSQDRTFRFISKQTSPECAFWSSR